MLSSPAIEIFKDNFFFFFFWYFVLCPDTISSNSNTNSYALKTSIYREVFHLSSSWYFSYLVFSELFSSDCWSQEWMGRGRFGFVSFPCSRQRRSSVSPARAAWTAAQPRAVRPVASRGGGLTTGGGLSTEPGRGLPRSATRGRVSGWQLAVQPRRRREAGSEPSAHRLRAAPAVVLARTAPSRSRRRGDPAALCPRTPRSVSGHLRKKVKPGSQSGRDSRPPPTYRRGFSSVCSAGRAGRVGSAARKE